MKRVAAAGAAFLACAATLSAHRLDEYLQATLFTIGKNQIEAQVRLTPGVSVFPAVMKQIDADGDGRLSAAEQHAYAERVVSDLSIAIDGAPLRLRLVSVAFPGIAEMKDGLGEITLQIAADVPPGAAHRRLTFENRHLSGISVYLVNCLVPADPEIRLASQNRNFQQSAYQLDYVQGAALLSLSGWAGPSLWMAAAALLLSAQLALRFRQRARQA
jgi:hypothetical protein